MPRLSDVPRCSRCLDRDWYRKWVSNVKLIGILPYICKKFKCKHPPKYHNEMPPRLPVSPPPPPKKLVSVAVKAGPQEVYGHETFTPYGTKHLQAPPPERPVPPKTHRSF